MSIGMETQTVARRHKGQGIASFVIGTLSAPVVVGLVGLAAMQHIKTGKVSPEMAMVLGLGLVAVIVIDLVGIGLGIFGVVDRASKKAFPTLGLVLNAAIVAFFAALVVIGLSIKAH